MKVGSWPGRYGETSHRNKRTALLSERIQALPVRQFAPPMINTAAVAKENVDMWIVPHGTCFVTPNGVGYHPLPTPSVRLRCRAQLGVFSSPRTFRENLPKMPRD